jgi:hypothetical protein
MSDANDPTPGALSSAAGDTFTETTSKSWLQRIVNSFVAALFGLILVIASIVGIFWNEGRAIDTARALAEGAGAVVDVDSGRVDPADQGKLVHVAGAAKAAAPLVDPEFHISAAGLKLLRNVEMYQWRQDERSQTHDKLGGGQETTTTYTYTKEWSPHQIESAGFREAAGHANPPMAFTRREMVAADAKLGAFALPGELLVKLPNDARFDVDPVGFSAPTGQSRPAQVVDGAIYVGADPGQPRIGDLRITYYLAPGGAISAVGAQTSDGLGPYLTKAGGTVYLIERGEVPAAAMFKEAERENALTTWIVRAGALLAMGIGFALILSPLSALAAVLPPLGGLVGFGAGLTAVVLALVVGPLTIAIAWFAVRPLMAIGIVAAGLIAAFLVSRLRSSRRSGLAPTPPAAR